VIFSDARSKEKLQQLARDAGGNAQLRQYEQAGHRRQGGRHWRLIRQAA
jgi:hypothetical protein